MLATVQVHHPIEYSSGTADQLLLVVHRLQQGLAARVAGELGPGRPPQRRVLGGEVAAQLVAETRSSGPARPRGRPWW
jgi:hypothetical protein